MSLLRRIRKDAKHLIRHPSKLLKLRHKATRKRVAQLAKARLFQTKVSNDWSSEDEHFHQRQYDNYEQYLAHQKLKIGFLNLSDYDQRFREHLAKRLGSMDLVREGSRVVCLAARIGSEVKAFKDVGCFAVGIDLNPGEDNQHVLHGDFHDLQFADNSVDIVYSNSLDHAFSIEKIVKEVKRVLCPGGVFLVEAIRGTDQGVEPQDFESFWWESIDDLTNLFEQSGLELIGRLPFDQPWKGVQLQLKNVQEPSTPLGEPEHASA